jgi:hypothetical protein
LSSSRPISNPKERITRNVHPLVEVTLVKLANGHKGSQAIH